MNVRAEPGVDVEVLPPFSAPPAAIVYVMPADVVRRVGAWGEEYEIASGEDVDLCFKVWVNDLDIVYDQRVLVQHVGKGTASRLDDWQGLWAKNRARFLEKWMGDGTAPRLDRSEPERFARNREIARGRGVDGPLLHGARPRGSPQSPVLRQERSGTDTLARLGAPLVAPDPPAAAGPLGEPARRRRAEPSSSTERAVAKQLAVIFTPAPRSSVVL